MGASAIPNFPRFDRLSLQQKAEIDAFTDHHLPYSEYTFANMWCWDLDDTAALSLLNGNLVLRFREYESGLPFLSFLGTADTRETALTLLRYSESKLERSQLCLIPEVSASPRDSDGDDPLEMLEDRDNFDYVLDLHALASFAGPAFRRKRQAAAHFQSAYMPSVRTLDLTEKHDQELVLATFAEWAESRQKTLEIISDEMQALQRAFEIWCTGSLVATGIMVGPKLAAFAICELLSNHFANGLFSKADVRMRGTFEFLRQAQARQLLQLGCDWICVQQDLGHPGLRQAKLSYRPVRFLRKYTIHRSGVERIAAMAPARESSYSL